MKKKESTNHRQIWNDEYDRRCQELNDLLAAKIHGENNRQSFNAAVVETYEHLQVAPEDLDFECRAFVRLLVDDYLAL
jgi:hypothetical protein